MQFAEKNSGQLFHDHPHLELSSNKDLNTHSGFLAKLHDQVHGHSLLLSTVCTCTAESIPSETLAELL